jgi:hypothetical protein
MKPDGEGIADYKMVFCSDRSGFERVSGCRLLVSRRYDRLLTIPNKPSLLFHRQGVSPQNPQVLSGRFPLHNPCGPL